MTEAQSPGILDAHVKQAVRIVTSVPTATARTAPMPQLVDPGGDAQIAAQQHLP